MLLVALRRHLGEGAIERLAVEGSTWSENAAAEACGTTDDDRLSSEAAASPRWRPPTGADRGLVAPAPADHIVGRQRGRKLGLS
jgi:hypothetical protein